MNLYKINKKLEYLINSSKADAENIPDVLSLYNTLGIEIMGRKIYKDLSVKKCFNKSIKHKEFPSYIGKPMEGFYQQDIIDQDIREVRCLCVNGIPNKYSLIGGLIAHRFNINNFVFDVYKKEHDNEVYLMEVNELHLSTIDKQHLDFIYSQIL